MGFQIEEVTGSIFDGIKNIPIIGYPIGSPLLISLFIITIIIVLFYLLYDVDDPFHSLFKIATITAVPTIIYMYAHDSYTTNRIKTDLEDDYMLQDFGNNLEISEKDLINPNVPPPVRENPFE